MSYADNKAKLANKKSSNKQSTNGNSNCSQGSAKSIDLSKMGLSQDDQLKYQSLIHLIAKENFPQGEWSSDKKTTSKSQSQSSLVRFIICIFLTLLSISCVVYFMGFIGM